MQISKLVVSVYILVFFFTDYSQGTMSVSPIEKAKNKIQELNDLYDTIMKHISSLRRMADTNNESTADLKIDDIKRSVLLRIPLKSSIEPLISKAACFNGDKQISTSLIKELTEIMKKIYEAQYEKNTVISDLEAAIKKAKKTYQKNCATRYDARFYLPDQTPYRKIYIKKGINTTSIPKYVLKRVNGKEVTCEEISLNENVSLFFPSSGAQPTTAESMEYSGAKNIGDDAITHFYMKMFGWSESKIKAGFNKNNKEQVIIDFNTQNFNPYDGLHISSTKPEEVELFWNLFRQIASTSVGRVFLYRLLIEIRRVDKDGHGTAETTDISSEKRNQYRAITAACCKEEKVNEINCEGTFSFAREIKSGVTMGIVFSNNTKTPIPTINYNYFLGDKNQQPIVQLRRPLYIALFHEMLHWYQHLRYYKRAKKEKVANFITNKNLPNGLLSFYYDKYEDTEDFWSSNTLWGSDGSIEIDEMRVIWGIPQTDNGAFLNGDEISENLLRYFSTLNFEKEVENKNMKKYLRFNSTPITTGKNMEAQSKVILKMIESLDNISKLYDNSTMVGK